MISNVMTPPGADRTAEVTPVAVTNVFELMNTSRVAMRAVRATISAAVSVSDAAPMFNRNAGSSATSDPLLATYNGGVAARAVATAPATSIGLSTK